ncbi:glutathione S-transferase theta-3 [Scaptodrosophila lebanonensis]|uniref:Glutathione S-transferase theta-3 n=1 Tax=Drosophila lebanonensis TaxID=7225 RepID=A0A6J2U4G0_DROLE|nr:glutathione S-transferase theta-3 [Scaptodrosophila lebanonensis]
MTQPVKFYFDFLNQSSRALYILFEASKIPFEAIPISMLKGEHLTGEFRDNVNRFRKLPAITDHGFQLSENVAIFRHLSREKLVPEHWYPRRHLGRSRIDEYLAWQERHMGVACTDYFQQKWLVPYLQKTRPGDNAVSLARKQLDHTLNDFETLFLNSRKFMIGDNISYADLNAICEIDQPKSIGYNPFQNRNKLARWYEAVRDELGLYYKNVHDEFERNLKLRNAEQSGAQARARALEQ